MDEQKVPFNQRKKLAQSFKNLIKKSMDTIESAKAVKFGTQEKDEQHSLFVHQEDYKLNLLNKKENLFELRSEGKFLQNCLNDIVNKNIMSSEKGLDFDDLEDKIMNANFSDFRQNYFQKELSVANSPIKQIPRKIYKSEFPKYSDTTLNFKDIVNSNRKVSLLDIIATPLRKAKLYRNTTTNLNKKYSPKISLKRTCSPQSFKLDAGVPPQRSSSRKTNVNDSVKVDITRMEEIDTELKCIDSQDRGLLKTRRAPVYYSKRDKFRILQKKHLIYDSRSEDEVEWNDSTKILIHPDSRFKEVWDIVIFLVTLYNIVYVPYTMAFVENPPPTQLILDILSDVIYILDFVFQFLIPVKVKHAQSKEDKFLMNKSEIALHYLLSWLVLDFISSMPVNSAINIVQLLDDSDSYFYSPTLSKLASIAKFSRIYRIMKLIKLLKLIKIFNNHDKSTFHDRIDIIDQYNISVTMKRLLFFILYFLVLNHMLACIFVFIGSLNYPSWISNSGLIDSPSGDLYIASLYFNLVTIFTIGYGDITSISIGEKIYNIILLLLGIFTYTYAVSSISYIIERSDERTIIYNKNMDYLENVKMKYKIPNNLYGRILRFLKYDYLVNKTDSYILIDDLPMILKNALINTMHKDMLSSFIFFKFTKNADFNVRVVAALRPLKAVRSDILINEGDHIEELIFVKRGILTIEKFYKGHIIKVLEIRRNEHFGEVEMLLNIRCSFTVKVRSKVCELFLIKKTDLIDIGTEYQETFEIITQRSSYNMLQMTALVHQLQTKIDVKEMIKIERKRRKSKLTRKSFKNNDSDESLNEEEHENQEMIDNELEKLIFDLNKKNSGEHHSDNQGNIDKKINQLVSNSNQMKSSLGTGSVSVMQYRRQSHINSTPKLLSASFAERQSIKSTDKAIKKRNSHKPMPTVSLNTKNSMTEKKSPALNINSNNSMKPTIGYKVISSPSLHPDIIDRQSKRKDFRKASVLLKCEINKNLNDSSLNLKNPKSFYSKFIQKSKEQREQNENERANKKLDNLMKLFNHE
jgi:CRP-like cAMP-binding protein